jgi:hypothetical protein
MRLEYTDDADANAIFLQARDNNADLKFEIGADGNVGIGMSALGGRLMSRGLGTTTGVNFQTQNSSGTPLVTMLDNGNIGLGTTGPGSKIYINSSASYPEINIASETVDGGVLELTSVSGSYQIYTQGQDLRFWDTTDRVAIQFGGNVGIGTIEAITKLDVAGPIFIDGDGGGSKGDIFIGGGGWPYSIGVGWSAQSSTLRFNAVGTAGGTADFRDLWIYDGKTNVIASFTGSSGNVGIGTTAPLQRFHVRVDQNAGTGILVENGTNNTNALASLDTTSATSEGVLIAFPASHTLYGAHFADRVALLANNSAGYETAGLDIGAIHTTADIRFYTAGIATTNERMRILSGGNVGVGTTAPERLLEVQGAEATNADLVLDADDGDDNADTWFIQSTAADNTLRFLNHTTTLATVQSDGNLGIGTTSPDTKLEVTTTAGSSPDITLTAYGVNATSVPAIVARAARGSEGSETAVQSGDRLASFRATAHDGTSWSSGAAGFEVLAAQNWTGAAHGTEMKFETTTNGSASRTEKMRITNAGNVGIGTSTPAELLDVAGEIELDIDTANDTTIGVCKNTTDGTSTATQFRECNGTPGDIAEWYETNGDVRAGDIVYLTEEIFTYQEELIDPRTGLPKLKDGVTPDERGNYRREDRVMAERNFSILSKATVQTLDRAIGIVSTSPYQSFGKGVFVGKNPQPIALIGRVPTNVSLENGPIDVGNMITISSQAGIGMKATKPGRVIGYALEPFLGSAEGGNHGQIMVFINPHWFGGPEDLKLDEIQGMKQRLDALEEQNRILREVFCRNSPSDSICVN